MVQLYFHTREILEQYGAGKNETAICFYGTAEKPVAIERSEGEYYCARLDDLCYDEIHERFGSVSRYFRDADVIAEMTIRAVAEGRTLVFEKCDLGASCAAAVLEFFTGGGLSIYAHYPNEKYSLNIVVFRKLYETLCCMKLLMNDISFDKLRTGRASFDRQENISKIYDLMCEEYAAYKKGDEECGSSLDNADEPCQTADGLFVSEYNYVYAGSEQNMVFGFYCVTKDKVWHLYNGIICAEILEEFLGKYKKEDIEYFGVSFWNKENDYGVSFFDSECGNCFTDEHLITYFNIIKDKYKTEQEDIFD